MIQNLSNPPIAKEKDQLLEIHHDVRIDPYYWLNKPDDPEVIDYLNAENAYTEQVLSPVKELQDALFSEMKNRIKNLESYPGGKNYEYVLDLVLSAMIERPEVKFIYLENSRDKKIGEILK